MYKTFYNPESIEAQFLGLTIWVPRCCWSNIAESKDNPRRAQYLLENIIIDGCIFGTTCWPLFLSRPTGDLGISGHFFWFCGSSMVSWGLILHCAAASDPVFFCICEAMRTSIEYSALPSPPSSETPEPRLYCVTKDVDKNSPCSVAYIAFVRGWCVFH